MQSRRVTIYHSPDADDAFMFYGLTTGKVTYPGYEFAHALKDIESLNQMARRGEIDCTAVSVHAYAYLSDKYVILRSGASMGGADYGPRLISNATFDLKDGTCRRLAIPGELTSAALALRIYLAQNNISAELVNLHFEAVQDAVKRGEVDAGVIIHEGQITHEREGLVTILDLGKWWWESQNLPLPLGVNIVHRNLGAEGISATATVLKGTIEYSLAHRQEALAYAMSYGRGISLEEADKFVGWYVNDLTVDLGERGIRSIRLFLSLGAQLGIIPEVEATFA
ncbi:MAG: ABC transporter substrate-binding protein [Proteobacteria bacterium]|nr:ABC transporter substrate-binding protein [Pseudomonadota bacterium]